ncbi:MAG: acyltransferase [Pontiellaceae bacterium]|nr:acyltransferase [Pontiellaceae bacterium]MBN2784719.1 acyltransferase [Pontiellaceae bacterium]
MFLDYLRVIAIAMVLIVHASEIFYIGDDGIAISGTDGFWVNLLNSAARSCVPLFVMASGYLLLPVTQSPGVFYTRRLSRILIPFIIWSILYATLPALWGQMQVSDVKHQLLTLTYNFNLSSGHLWFVYMLIGLYLIMPVLSPWLQTTSKRFLQAAIAIWFISTFHHVIKLIVPGMLGECYWNEFHSLYYVSGYVGYLLLAFYFKQHIHWSNAKNLAVGIPLFIAGYALTVFYFNAVMDTAGSLYELEIAWRFCTPNIVMMTAGLFLIIKCINRESRLIRLLSKYSYGIYLCHIFFLGACYQMIIKPLELETPEAIMLTGLLTFALSAILVGILSLLPKNKYLIG